MKELSEYDKQALDFIRNHGLKMRITLSDSKPAPWGDEDGHFRHHYRVTLSKSPREEVNTYRGEDGAMKVGPFQVPGKRITFDFWGSAADMEKGEDPTAYDVLSCISSDVYCPTTFEEFCGEYGENQDSIKAKQTFNRANRFAKRLRDFFTAEEIQALAEIQ